MSAVEEYLDNHPFRPWDQDSWDERSSLIDLAFHKSDVIFTPLVGNTISMPKGVGWNDYSYVGAELVKSHVNHNQIGRYDRWTTPIYVDTRQRRVQARHRWGVKTQYDSNVLPLAVM